MTTEKNLAIALATVEAVNFGPEEFDRAVQDVIARGKKWRQVRRETRRALGALLTYMEESGATVFHVVTKGADSCRA